MTVITATAIVGVTTTVAIAMMVIAIMAAISVGIVITIGATTAVTTAITVGTIATIVVTTSTTVTVTIAGTRIAPATGMGERISDASTAADILRHVATTIVTGATAIICRERTIRAATSCATIMCIT